MNEEAVKVVAEAIHAATCVGKNRPTGCDTPYRAGTDDEAARAAITAYTGHLLAQGGFSDGDMEFRTSRAVLNGLDKAAGTVDMEPLWATVRDLFAAGIAHATANLRAKVAAVEALLPRPGSYIGSAGVVLVDDLITALNPTTEGGGGDPRVLTDILLVSYGPTLGTPADGVQPLDGGVA